MKLSPSPLGTKLTTAFVSDAGDTFFRTSEGVWLVSLHAEAAVNVQAAYEVLMANGIPVSASGGDPEARPLADRALRIPSVPEVSAADLQAAKALAGSAAGVGALGGSALGRGVTQASGQQESGKWPDSAQAAGSNKEAERARFMSPPSVEERLGLLEVAIRELTEKSKVRSAGAARYQGPGLIDLVYKMMDKIPDAGSISLAELEEEEEGAGCLGCGGMIAGAQGAVAGAGTAGSFPAVKAAAEAAMRHHYFGLGAAAVAGTLGRPDPRQMETGRPIGGPRMVSLLDFLKLIQSGAIPADAYLAVG